MMWEIKNRALAGIAGKTAGIRNEAAVDADTLDIYVYSDVDKKWWWDDDCIGAKDFQEMLEKNPNAKNINVYINSYGGSVSEGVAIYNQLKRHKAYVTAYIDGFACSIASVIPMAADKIVMSDCSMLMIHNPWTCACGNSKDMRKCADDLDKILDGCIIPAYLGKINGKISEEKLRELLDSSEMLTPAECLAYGFVDEVAESTVDKESAKAKYNEFVNAAKEMFMNQFVPKAKEKHPEPEQPAEPEPKTPEAPAEPEAQEEPKAPEPEAPAPAEDKAQKTNNLFMKMLKGEI